METATSDKSDKDDRTGKDKLVVFVFRKLLFRRKSKVKNTMAKCNIETSPPSDTPPVNLTTSVSPTDRAIVFGGVLGGAALFGGAIGGTYFAGIGAVIGAVLGAIVGLALGGKVAYPNSAESQKNSRNLK